MIHKKNKLLFLSRDRFPPSRVDVTVTFGDKLPQKGFEIDWILTPIDENVRPYLSVWRGHNVYIGRCLKKSVFFSTVLNRAFDLINDLGVFKRLKSKKYDVVQVKDKFLSAVFCLLACKLYRVKFVYWLSYPYHEEAKELLKSKNIAKKIFYFLKWKYIDFILFKILAPNADHVFVQSDQMLMDFSEKNVCKNKLTSVPMGVSVELLPEIKTYNNKHGYEILYLGTLSRVRKLDFMIRVLMLVHEKFPSAKLVFLGAGEVSSDEEFLLRYAAKNNVENSVLITGKMPQKEAWKRVQETSVCVSPFFPNPVLACSSPTKLVEYMALGKAAVANNILDQSNLINESGGGICVEFDEEAFANAICSLLSDTDKANEMGKKGREYVLRKRNYDVLSDVVINAYSEKILA